MNKYAMIILAFLCFSCTDKDDFGVEKKPCDYHTYTFDRKCSCGDPEKGPFSTMSCSYNKCAEHGEKGPTTCEECNCP